MRDAVVRCGATFTSPGLVLIDLTSSYRSKPSLERLVTFHRNCESLRRKRRLILLYRASTWVWSTPIDIGARGCDHPPHKSVQLGRRQGIDERMLYLGGTSSRIEQL